MREAVLDSNDALNIACTTVDDQHDDKRWRRADACAIAPHAVRDACVVESGLVEEDEPAALWSVPAASPMIVDGEWRCRASCSASRSDGE